jgi:hypothetical protein
MKKFLTFWLSATRDQAKDTGMALTLICLLVALFGHKNAFLGAGVVILVLDMTKPALFKPAAKLWFGLSHLLGTVMSKVLLSVIFFVVLTPIGLLRRVFGQDAMQKGKWKKGSGSVFRVRDHKFSPNNIETPY